MKLEVSAISNFGQGIASDDNNKKIFISKSVTGDVVEAEFLRRNSKFSSARITNIIKASNFRRVAECKYFDECGGCSLQHLKNDFYKDFKIKNITDLLNRNGIKFDNEIKFVEIGKSSRRRVNFHVKNNSLGFFKESSNDLVVIDQCLMLTEELDNLISKLQHLLTILPSNFVQQISICQFDNVIDIIFKLSQKGIPLAINEVLVEFAKRNKVVNLSYEENKEITPVYFTTVPNLNLGNIKIDIYGSIFLQATSKGQNAIIKEIIAFIEAEDIKNVIDLYCGIGTYSFSIAHLEKIRKITAVEGIDLMVQNIDKNIKKHGLAHKISTKNRDLVLNPLRNEELENYDLVIINPPRNGAQAQVNQLVNASVKNVIMVSCDLNSFIKDAKILTQNGFSLKSTTAIDQFYYTAHIELVAIFKRDK